MNRRQATKWRARARKERKLMLRWMRTMKPHMKPRWRQWWKAYYYRWDAEFKKENEDGELVSETIYGGPVGGGKCMIQLPGTNMFVDPMAYGDEEIEEKGE